MLIKNNIITKDNLITVTEDTTIKEALQLLNNYNYRCIPILDKSKKIFRGNIYKSSIYKHLSNDQDMNLPVTYLATNFTKFIELNDSIFKIFFTIKKLPYIAVLDEQKNFYGILTHTNLLHILEKGWNINNGGYILTIHSSTDKHALANITKIISKYTKILNCITLDNNNIRETIITIPKDTPEITRYKIVNNLNKKNLTVQKIECLSFKQPRS